MASWGQFAAAEPELAAAIRALVCQYGPGLAYLATVRPDGGPRIHPVSPVITDDGLFCFVLPSPKRHDLDRDGRYSLHSYPSPDSDDEAYVSGRAFPLVDELTVAALARQTHAAPDVDWRVYELTVEVAMLVHRTSPPAPAHHTVWKVPNARENHPCTKAVDSVQ